MKIIPLIFGVLMLSSCTKNETIVVVAKKPLFYRLAIYDLDGSVAYSTVLTTKVSEIISGVNGDPCAEDDFCKKHPDNIKCRTMPLVLSVWNLQTANNKTYLVWRTTYEQNLDKFVIQRSYDGSAFFPVVNLQPKGAGNYYSYVDQWVQ